MRQVTVRELQQSIRNVIEQVERGETVEVTRRRRPVARLSPIQKPRHVVTWPDLDARARKVLGSRVIRPGAGARILADRDRS
jgi:prevent-host-death family protein